MFPRSQCWAGSCALRWPQTAGIKDQAVRITRNNAYYLLQECISKKDLGFGRHLQSHMVSNGLDSTAVLADHLIRLFAYHGNLIESNEAFNKIARPSARTWIAVIQANAKLGQGELALELYNSMLQCAFECNKYIYLAILKACATTSFLPGGRLAHEQMYKSELRADGTLGNTLLDMYVKCNSLGEALNLFDKLPDRTVVSWGALISGYAQQKNGILAVELFEVMRQEGLKPDRVIFLSILKACTGICFIEQCRFIHCQIIQSGLHSDLIVGNTIVDMYAKFGGLDEAVKVFEQLPCRDMVSWGALIGGFAQHGEYCLALESFEEMQQEGIKPAAATFYSILKACAYVGGTEQGRLIHNQVIEDVIQQDVVMGSSLIHMYVNCKSLEEARGVFDKLASPDLVSWATMIAGFIQHGKYILALEFFVKMQEEGINATDTVLFSALKACAGTGAIEHGRIIHDGIIGRRSLTILGNTLLDMYAKCGSLQEAHLMFVRLPNQDVVSWGAIITGYTQLNESSVALEIFEEMQQEGIKPTNITFLSVLKACATLRYVEQGRLIHGKIINSGLQMDIMVGSSLINMYVRCACLQEAQDVFNKLLFKDVVSWSALISGYALYEEQELALKCFDKMQRENLNPNSLTFVAILKACSSTRAIEYGRLIHEQLIKDGNSSDNLLGSSLIDMYVKCGSLKEGRSIFDNLVDADSVSWETMISGYAECGEPHLCLECFTSMEQNGIKPSQVTFSSALKSCASLGARVQGRLIHVQFRESGIQSQIIGSALVDMYAKCGGLEEARKVYENFPNHDVYSWGAIIAGYVQYGQSFLALECYEEMHQMGINPNDFVFVNLLRVCGNIGSIEHGRLIHSHIIKSRMQWTEIGSKFIDMYFRCGSSEEAFGVFENLTNQNIISCNAMIAGYVEHEKNSLALKVFEKMQERNIEPTIVTFLNLSKACAMLRFVMQGRLIHDHIIKIGLQVNVVIGSSLVDMYAKCGSLEEACKVFEELPCRDAVSWGAMIAGYANYGDGFAALECFKNMQQGNVKPTNITFLSILKACASLGAIEHGRQVYNQLIHYDIKLDILVGSSLIDMYAKCGSLEEAHRLFNTLSDQDVVSWGAMIAAYAQHGEGQPALECFQEMQQGGLIPDKASFTSVLVACSHAGLVNEGYLYFISMSDYHITPSICHHTCLVDLLCRAGCLHEARDMLESNIQHDITGWLCLLSSCKIHEKLELGKQCFGQLILVGSRCSSAYVLMSNILADFHKNASNMLISGDIKELWEDIDRNTEFSYTQMSQICPNR